MVTGQHRVVLDTSFVTRESRDGRHLRMLAKMGCTLVMADSLSYECCTSGEAGRLVPPYQAIAILEPASCPVGRA